MMPSLQRGPQPAVNPPTPPSAAAARSIPIAARTIELVTEALLRAQRLAASVDAVQAALGGAEAPKVSPLTQLLSNALGAMQGEAVNEAPVERVDTHTFTIAQLDEEFLRRLMLERGWQQAALIVGSAQGEALARRVLHGASPESRLQEQIKLMPLSGGHRIEQMDGWTLVEPDE